MVKEARKRRRLIKGVKTSRSRHKAFSSLVALASVQFSHRCTLDPKHMRNCMHTSVITQHEFLMIALWLCFMLCRHNPKTRPCLLARPRMLQEVSGELPIFVSGGSLGGGLSVCLCLQRPTFFRGWRQSSSQERRCHDCVYKPHAKMVQSCTIY